jgi:hypothetical protein
MPTIFYSAHKFSDFTMALQQDLILKLRNVFLCFKIPDNNIGYLKGFFSHDDK